MKPTFLIAFFSTIVFVPSFAQDTNPNDSSSTLVVQPSPPTATPSPPLVIEPSAQQTADPFIPEGTDDPDVLAASDTDASDHSDSDNPDGILNYYFLLLALIVIIIIILYITWSRRRRKRLETFRNDRTNALHRDLNRWDRWTPNGAWIGHRRGLRRERHQEEGLNENGEAPPPYVPSQPPPVVLREDGSDHGRLHSVPLQDLPSDRPKPPDYAAHSH